ncbi:MAG: hypothetical protein HYX29_06795 [Solirubrobacterales bacterium]|nr:hypothetical protein [Solirubrobacterales bacterium]
MELLVGLLFFVPLAAVLAMRLRTRRRGVQLPWFYNLKDVEPLLSESQLRTYKRFRFRAIPVALVILVAAWFARSNNPEIFYLLLGISATISASGAVWLEYVVASGRVRQSDGPRSQWARFLSSAWPASSLGSRSLRSVFSLRRA